MIHKAIDILKNRWPEAVLVVVLSAAWLLLYGELADSAQAADQANTQLPFWPNFFLGLGVMVVFTVCLMLWLGFLKTSAVDGSRPQQPGFLVRCGQPYFWKMFFFLFVYQFLCSIIVAAVLVGIWLAWKADLTASQEQILAQVEQFVISSRLTEVIALLVYAVFIKPLLVVIARVVVYENTPLQALAAMGRYRLGEIRHLFAWVVGGFSVIIAVTAGSLLAAEQTVVYYTLLAVYHLLFCGLMLFLMLLAVLWMQGHRNAEQAPLPQESV